MYLLRHTFRRTARCLVTKPVMRAYSEQPNGKSPKPTLWSRRFMPGVIFGLASGFTFGLYLNYTKKHKKVGLDALPADNSSVNLQPPTDIPPFPPTISINREIFQAIGTGVRTVTFLNFHVYAVGMYIAADDVHSARDVMESLRPKYNPSNDKAEWEKLLRDPKSGTEIVNDLLKANVRFAVRIVPVRNTDFNHLRDGFVRSITNYVEFKALQNPEIGLSISEIKRAFGRKRKLKKGDVLTWSRDISGGMTAWYGDVDEDKELLGSPSNPDVSRLFFLQYLSGSKPNSPTLKENSVKGLVSLLT